MCGICGIISPTLGARLGPVVARMNAALIHRGPDSEGQFTNEVCAIAMRRLAIIDLATGDQPIHNDDGLLSIVFNGEIYNFQSLRERAVCDGHRFKTHGDTEVILRLYEEKGVKALPLLHGMFAFCIYDQRDHSLFLARDRFGEKPLYYAKHNDSFAFSSELQSLLVWQDLPRRINYEALYYLLHVGYIPAPLTLFAGIYQLPAGHWMRWCGGQLRSEPYYKPHYQPDPALTDPHVAVESLRESLLAAVKRQMISDVPLGAFLSGGIDSSTVVAAMQQVSSRPVKTFTVRFDNNDYDESPVARAVAEHLGTDHHEFVVGNAHFEAEDMERIVRHVGQPFLDSSAIPTYFLSREIRRNVTVALSGDGGDEIFAGYPYFAQSLRIDSLARIPNPVLGLTERTLRLATALPALEKKPVIRQLWRAVQVAQLPANQRPGAMETIFETDAMLDIASPTLRERWSGVKNTYTPRTLDAVAEASRLRQLMHYRLAFSLPEDMLTKVDRMSMATSLEVRAPLLSAEVSDFAMKLPETMLLNKGVRKYILREVGKKWLPEVVYSHPKYGFTIPLHTFQNNRYAQLCREYITDNPHPLISDLFNREAVQNIVQRGINQTADRAQVSVHRSSHQLWGLLQLGFWAQHFKVNP